MLAELLSSEPIQVFLVMLVLALLSLLLRQVEMVLQSRGLLRAAHAVASIRALLVDAPTIAARLVAAAKGREPMPTMPPVLDPNERKTPNEEQPK